MFIRLFKEKDNPETAVVININQISMAFPLHTEGKSPRCQLLLTDGTSVRVDHTLDDVLDDVMHAMQMVTKNASYLLGKAVQKAFQNA